MSLYTALTNAISGLSAFQRGTQIVSENISNANNEHYRVRREVYTDIGGTQAGVNIVQVQRRTDQLLQTRLWDASAASEAEKVRDRYYRRVEELTGASESKSYLSDGVTALSKAFIEFEAAPDVDSAQVVVFRAAQDLEYEFQRVGQSLFELRSAINEEIGATITDVNAAIQEIASLNQSILRTSRRQNDFSQLENLVEERISVVAGSINVRVFRDDSTGIFRVYTRDGSILLADTRAGLNLDWSPERDTLVNTVSGFDITGTIPEGKLKAQLDFLARENRVLPNGTVVNVLQNDDPRVGVLTKYERHLDEMARLLVADTSGTRQGLADGSLRDAAGNFATGVPQSQSDTFANSFGRRLYPDQIYVDATLATGGAGNEFFATRSLLRTVANKFRDGLANAALNDPYVTVDLTTEERAIFASYQGQAAAAGTKTLNFNVDKANAADPNNTTSRANAANILTTIQTRLNGLAIPADVLHVKEQQAFTRRDAVVVQPPAKPAAPSTSNPLTLADVRTMVANLTTYLQDFPAVAGSQSLVATYNAWNDYQKHEFQSLVNVINPDILVAATFPPTNPAFNLSHNEVTEIRSRLNQLIQFDTNPPTGSNVGSLEYYWADKLFTASSPRDMDLTDVTRFTLSVNPQGLSLLSDMRVDTRRLNSVVDNLLAPRRTIDTAGISIRDHDYDGIARQLSIDFARRSEQVSRAYQQTSGVTTALDDRLKDETGVNIDEEVSRMIILQNSYGAAARLITSINRMFEALEETL